MEEGEISSEPQCPFDTTTTPIIILLDNNKSKSKADQFDDLFKDDKGGD